jgi:copper chaperone
MMETKTFTVPNIGCEGCVGKIKQELGQLAGVVRVDADADTQVVTVQWSDPALWQQIEARLIEIDYAPAKVSDSV